MRPRPWLVAALTASAAAACGSSKEEPSKAPAGSAARPTTVVAPAAPAPASRPSQGTMPRMPPPRLADDPARPAKVALGHALFFDKRLSVDGSMACYSCHQDEHGNGGADPRAVGPGGKQLPRHSPVIWNVAYLDGSFYWDGRAATLEAQATAAWQGGNMGVGEGNLPAKTAELAAIPGYAKLFEAAFPGRPPSPELVVAALAEYERTLICDDTAYDRFAAGDRAALSEAQQRGLDVFLGKGACTACHAPPFFTTAMPVSGGVYFNVGIGTRDVPEDQVDIGRMKVTSNPADWAAFRPPSLRNVARSAPYFHDGSVPTLREAVALMAGGGIPNKNLSPILSDRKLTPAELDDLVAFLGALDCPGRLDPPAMMP